LLFGSLLSSTNFIFLNPPHSIHGCSLQIELIPKKAFSTIFNTIALLIHQE
jgi:hypothetical protein